MKFILLNKFRYKFYIPFIGRAGLWSYQRGGALVLQRGAFGRGGGGGGAFALPRQTRGGFCQGGLMSYTRQISPQNKIIYGKIGPLDIDR